MVYGNQMEIITGVSKCWNNRGRTKNHPRANKHWTIYGYDANGKLVTRRVSALEAFYAKLKRKQLQSVQCNGCGTKYKIIKGTKLQCCSSGTDL